MQHAVERFKRREGRAMGDNISRQAALDAVSYETFECYQARKDIRALPSTDEWIPCSERLPEEHEWIGTKRFGTTISDKVHITFDVNGERFVKTLSLQNGELSNHEKRIMDTFYKGWKMIAWMPLPEPYKGGK